MTQADLKRSLRRGVAVLLVPLSLLCVQVGTVTARLADGAALPGVSRTLGVLLVATALLYLAVSVGRQVAAAADTPF